MLNKLQVEKAEAEKNFFAAVKHLKKFRKQISPVFESSLQNANKRFKDNLLKTVQNDKDLVKIVEDDGMTVEEFVMNRKPLYNENESDAFSYFVRTFILEHFEIENIDKDIKSIENEKLIIKHQEEGKLAAEFASRKEELENMTYEEFQREIGEYELLEVTCKIKSEIFELKETELLIHRVIDLYRKNNDIFKNNIQSDTNIKSLNKNLPDSKDFFATRSNEFNETFKQSYMSKRNALISDGWGVLPEISVGNKGTGKLSVNLSNAQLFVDNELEAIRKKMNPSQLKIVNFIEMQANKEKDIFLNLSIDDFFSLTEQKRRPEVVRSFIENVEIISKFTMKMPTKFNNQYRTIESNYLDFKGIIYADSDEATLSIRKGKKIVGVRVILEEWCKYTNENQVKYIPNEYWKLKKQNAIIFCDKLTQIMRVSQFDNKRRKCVKTNKHLYKIPVKTLVNMMESDFKTIESKGYSWLKAQLEDSFDELTNLGFSFHFNEYNFDSFEELISLNIEFTNEKLTQSYIESL
ncbi:hypothetical protein RW25_11285 [Bacillus sp. L_1B0_8]|uniref:hypothetical protein n=1 Tax=unclassified Bacillus (in: firmicutes) TaxID=185979 RepID=UPI0005B6FDDA|nr:MULTISPECIES: hypothetical protein [unclassified Bacillus (in: firmicutes)]KIQ89479.1 hypothetical protein RT27_07100 [Bacillus sp. L_1B0_5]KIQ89492.1 hypothetical protein RW25_11285 [Bacillus sp. L_1B0_8]